MDELLRNISHAFQDAGIASGVDRGDALGNRLVEDVWREIVSVSDRQATDEEVTLEDFLTRAGSERDDEFTSSSVRPSEFAVDSMFQRKFRDLGFQNDNGGVEAGCAGKRKHVDGDTDRVLQQKQIRMIKNRESAARSRERKQAYTVELEALVTQLEEENSKLMREEAEQSKKRFNELMKNNIPVIQKRKPLRRVNSLSW